jgi:hypothetical protein
MLMVHQHTLSTRHAGVIDRRIAGATNGVCVHSTALPWLPASSP